MSKNEPLSASPSEENDQPTSEPRKQAASGLYTGRRINWSPFRAFMGIVSLVVLLWLTLSFDGVQHVQTPASVGPSQVFRLEEADTARYQWTLFNGVNPGNPAIESQQLLRFEQSDIVELTLAEGLVNGQRVVAGDALVHFRSPTNVLRLEELMADRAVLQAQRALLEAGQRPEAIAEAEQRLEVARARRLRDQAELDRLQALEEQGAVAEADLETAELRDRLRANQVELEQAALELESAPTRPEEFEEIDARLVGTNARIAALEQILEGQTVTSPIDGTINLGGDALIEVLSTDSIVIHLPIPADDRYLLDIGNTVEFTTHLRGRQIFEGSLVDIADQPSTLGMEQVYWATAIIESGAELRIGMTGTARIPLTDEESGIFGNLRRQLTGP